MDNLDQNFWKKCSSCKNPISWNSVYYVCSVTTCNGQRTGYAFCTISCFERHLPGARHKDAGAVEKRSPPLSQTQSQDLRTPARIMVKSQNPVTSSSAALPQEVLIIASRLKDYIQARADMNTSASVMDVLSDQVRKLCDRAIEKARSEGRKTVLDRDFDFLKNS